MVMVTIAVLNLKGGCGKTTIALNLAAVLAERGRRPLVVDLDPQQSATRWARGAAPVETGFNLRDSVLPLRIDRRADRFRVQLSDAAGHSGADLVVMDAPPELSDPALVAALLADLVLVPVTPSPLDLWAAEAAVQTARDARRERGGRTPLVALIPSKLISGTVLAREIAATLAGLGEPVAPGITQRVALVEAAIAGQTIVSYAAGSPAHCEFRELAKYTFNRLKDIK